MQKKYTRYHHMIGALMFLSGNLFPEDFARAESSIFRNRAVSRRSLPHGSDQDWVPRRRIFDANKYLDNPDKYLQEIVADLGLPIFVKPMDQGTDRIIQINSLASLGNWADLSSKSISGRYELES